MLSVQSLYSGYGETQVLHDVSLTVPKGSIVTLLGRNGAGKSTLLKSIIGLLRKRTGSIVFDGQETIDMPTHHIARLGIGYCPDDRGIYGSLTVLENLTLPPVIKAGGMSLDEIGALFPRLMERRRSHGLQLSGGEQQMLAIARLLRTGATFLLLDEPTEGLAPVIVNHLNQIIRDLRERGYTILLVEQSFRFAASLADQHYIIENGKIVDRILAENVEQEKTKIESYLGI